jgi:hypothetical protein
MERRTFLDLTQYMISNLSASPACSEGRMVALMLLPTEKKFVCFLHEKFQYYLWNYTQYRFRILLKAFRTTVNLLTSEMSRRSMPHFTHFPLYKFLSIVFIVILSRNLLKCIFYVHYIWKKVNVYLQSLMMKVPDHLYVLGDTYTCHT